MDDTFYVNTSILPSADEMERVEDIGPEVESSEEGIPSDISITLVLDAYNNVHVDMDCEGQENAMGQFLACLLNGYITDAVFAGISDMDMDDIQLANLATSFVGAKNRMAYATYAFERQNKESKAPVIQPVDMFKPDTYIKEQPSNEFPG
jgi:hypothetical protein